jgi:subtilisin family serine protease
VETEKGEAKMTIRPRTAVLLSLALAAAGTASASEYKPGEVIVKYKEGTQRSRTNMNVLYKAVGVANVRHYTGTMTGFEQLQLNDGIKVQDAIAELQKNEVVEYAQPNYILHALPIQEASAVNLQSDVGGAGPCWIPGVPLPPGCEDAPAAQRPGLQDAPADVNPPVVDPDLSQAYGLQKIGAIDAWSTFKGSKDLIVADIDTGIDYNHPDLSFNIWRNPNPSDKKDVAGFDFIHNDGLPFDDHEHGTHTTGTIGAVGGNGIGISGVTQRVSLMGLKFLSARGSGTTADAIRAIDYAITHGAKVLSNSWGGRGDNDNQALYDAIERAKAKDVLFIAAAGNDGADNDGSDASYPAAFDNENLISVAATDYMDQLAYFSNYGKKTTHVAAPGVKIYSTIPGGKYKAMSGTSMACPHVAGAAALIWSQHPSWTFKKVKDVLMKSVDQLPSLADKVATGGRINVKKALLVTE